MPCPVGCPDDADLFKPYCAVGWKSEDEPKANAFVYSEYSGASSV